MYEQFFQLRVKPFELTPNPDFIFLSRSHRKALTYIDYGIRERAGFILLTGDIGSGKTTIVRDLLNKNYERVVLAKVFNTKVNSEQLLAMINDEYGLPVQGKDKIGLIRNLNGYLIEQFARGNQPILIIDEAQNLSSELLEEIRMLSNLETADSKLLQIILVGQPELRDTLALPELLQLRQRISINCNLNPLDRSETEQYILHRLTVAGNPDAVIFEPEAFDLIHASSRGVPRLINIICDFALLTAFAETERIITLNMLRDVVHDLDFERHYWATADHREGPALTFPPPAANQPGSDLLPLLEEMAERLQRMENTRLSADEGMLKELNYRVSSLQNAFKYHVGETESLFTEFSRKLEQMRRELRPAQPEAGNTEMSGGRVWKINPA